MPESARELERKKAHSSSPGLVSYEVKRSPRRLVEGVAEAKSAGDVGEIRELRLIKVETQEQMRIWNELMIQGHPRGPGRGRPPALLSGKV